MSVTSAAFCSAISARSEAGRRRQRGELLGQVGPLLLVAARLAARLPGQQLDLGKLALEARDLLVEGGGKIGRRASEIGHPGADQSSGIRIQPWRIAYTTAWVRSFTESFRRMELMWFLTVCSLMESA